MCSTPVIKPITSAVMHSEGPYWDNLNQILYYVDTFNATAHRWEFKSCKSSSYKLENHNSIAIIVRIKNTKDEFVIGAERTLYKFSWPTSARETNKLSNLLMVEKDKLKNQFNDGKADSKGRLWIGSLTRNEDLSVTPNGGSLYMVSGDDLSNSQEKIANTSISNGLDWSTDNKKLYFIDSLTKTVVVYDYEADSGDIRNRKILIDLQKYPEVKGIPDGMTTDSDGNLWVAMFGGGSILNIDSNTGLIIRSIQMPVTYVTSVCFGGPELNILYATSSKLHINETELANEPLAGSVFEIRNLCVKGLPANEAVLK